MEEMKRLHAEINESELSKNEKTYLNKLVKDNLESISRNIKLQVKELREDWFIRVKGGLIDKS